MTTTPQSRSLTGNPSPPAATDARRDHDHGQDPGGHGADPLPGLRIRGRIVTPSAEDWDVTRNPWNVLVDQRPRAVVLPADADDVAATVQVATRHGLSITAQGPGHGASRSLAGTALDRTVLLRCSGLDDIWIDAAARVARVGAGVSWRALQAALTGTGLTGLVGSSGGVSVVGYCLGGGLSWFSRAYGTGAGSLRAVELVDHTGQRHWVTDASDPELMWALRGGGGDLGIVTAVEIDLFPAAERHGGTLAFPAASAPAVLRAFRDAALRAGESTTLWASLLHLPDIEAIPEPMRGQSFTLVQAMHLGQAHVLEALLAPIRAAGPLLRDAMRPVGLAEVGDVAEDPVDPSPTMLTATRVGALGDAVIDALVGAAGVGSGTPLLQVQVRHLGGALARQGAPAVAGPTDAAFQVSGLAVVPAPALVPVMNAGLDALLAVLRPWSVPGLTSTFLGRDDTIARAYPESVDRLRRLKRRVDPFGRIRSNHPLLPTP